MILHSLWQSERGFTLVEVMVVIIVMMVLATIAMSVWWPVVESRRVDTAANQVATELHRAQSSATNRLEDWRVEVDADTRNYRVGPDGGALSPQMLPERTEFLPGVSAVVFEANEEATITGGGNILVADTVDNDPCHEINVNPVTSRVEVLTNAC